MTESPVHLKPLLYVISSALGLIISGCMVGPDYHRPEVLVSQSWMDAGDNRVKSEAADYRYWWKNFNDPILDRLIDLAYTQNLSLQIAGVRVLEARAQLGIAIGDFFPQTQQVGGSLQRIRTSASSPSAIPSALFTQDQVQLAANWELDFWGKFRRGIQSAGAAWLATTADYDNALVSLTASVASSYINIRTLEKRIFIAHQNVETQQESLRIAEVRLKFGTVTLLDVEQATSQLNDTQASIPSLEIQLRQQKDALCVLLGIAPNDLADILKGDSDIPTSPREVVVGIPTDLLRRRPDVRSAEYQAVAQSAQIGAAKADLYPAFSLNGVFGFLSNNAGNSSLGKIFRWENRFYQIGPSFSWNIFNYGQITNNVRLQDARFQELLLTYQNTVLTAQQDVEDNLSAFLKSQERADYLAKSTQAAKNALDLAVKQYRAGIKDFTTVLTAQQSLLTAQDNLASTLGNISLGLVGVYRAIGGGWEIRDGKDLVSQAITKEMKGRTNWGGLLAPASYNPPVDAKPSPAVRLPDW
ncbi:MAG TPA: efflux transporter outer membrane subunit [Nitrospirota bacterium]|nr:efflux transporter outer membrane subunit [Nitrospirota bacterium]